jgi:lactoylglutathione lyase
MKYLHTAFRVDDLDSALSFYQDTLGLEVVHRFRGHRRPCTIVFLAAPDNNEAQIEVVHYDDPELRARTLGFSHVAYQVDDIYAACTELLNRGAQLPVPPGDGFMAIVRAPDGTEFELLQKGEAREPEEPWVSMPVAEDW